MTSERQLEAALTDVLQTMNQMLMDAYIKAYKAGCREGLEEGVQLARETFQRGIQAESERASTEPGDFGRGMRQAISDIGNFEIGLDDDLAAKGDREDE